MLTVHRAASTGALIGALADLLVVPPSDPFASDVVAVPAEGVERWLTQRLAHVLGAGAGQQDGVCANVLMPSPTRLLDGALASAGDEHARAVEAWAVEPLAWRVLDLIDDLVLGPAVDEVDASLLLLRTHLTGSATTSDAASAVGAGRRWALARRTAELLTRYGAARPDLLARWASGDDAGVPEDLRWQCTVFAALREALGPTPAELLPAACERLRQDPDLSDLPERLSIFGATRISTAHLMTLAALSEHRDVHLWVPHPGPGLWDAVAATEAPAELRRAEAADLVDLSHPLLASLSADVRELQQRLQIHVPAAATAVHDAPSGSSTLLDRLKGGLASDRLPDRADLQPVAVTDRSVQVHACHGRSRQVEVLRDVVLGLLADDPKLEPRDILVMCPDVEAYAPLVTGTFGDQTHPAGRLRVVLADRSPRQVNPLLTLTARLLDLAGRRITASQLLDLAATTPVRRKLRLDDDDLDTLQTWAVRAGVRWGLDATSRAPWHLDRLDDGTWSSGVDRLLLGAATTEPAALLGGALPLEHVDGTDLDLAGRLAELLDRTREALASLAGPLTAGGWTSALQTALGLLADVQPSDAWQWGNVDRELAAAVGADPGDRLLSRADITALLQDRLAGRPTRTGFRSGALTLCTLTPMRSVPHRVICLLGLDDTAFPRTPVPDGEDLLSRDPRAGDRDGRQEDRQSFLDAILAAQEHLVVIHSGWDVRTGAETAPAVPVGELLDALDLTATAPDGRPARTHVVTRHALHPFDPREFAVQAPASFDLTALRGAEAFGRPRTPPAPLVTGALAPAAPEDVDLNALTGFLTQPAQAFLRQRLQVTNPRDADDPDDALPLELDALQQWAVNDRVLGLVLGGTDVEDALAAEAARGTLPPAPLNKDLVRKARELTDLLVRRAGPYVATPPTRHPVLVDLPDGRRLVGSVGDVHGTTALTVTASKVRAKQLLRAWVALIALQASHPEMQWTAVVLGRNPDRGPKGLQATLTPPPGPDSLALVHRLVTVRDAGLRAPLPMPVDTTHALARELAGNRPVNAHRVGTAAWEGSFYRDGERAEPANELVWGPLSTFDTLAGWQAPDGLLPLGVTQAAASSDIGFLSPLAQAVWQPLLGALTTETFS